MVKLISHGPGRLNATPRLIASEVIRHIDDLPRQPVVIYMRVSKPEQCQGGNLRNRQTVLERNLGYRGFPAIASCDEQCSGRYLATADRPGLIKALDRARSEGVPLVTDCRNRFIRGENYNKLAQTDTVAQDQWTALKALADQYGVTLATLLPPDASPRAMRRYEESVANQCGKTPGRPPGRPIAQPSLRQRALELHQQGIPKRKIGKRLSVAESTVRWWIKAGAQ